MFVLFKIDDFNKMNFNYFNIIGNNIYTCNSSIDYIILV